MNKNNQNIQETLANYLRNYLEQNNLTQQALADQINAYFSKNIFPQPRINKLIAKKVMLRSYAFFLLCDFCKIHSSQLFPIAGYPPKPYEEKKCLCSLDKFKKSLGKHIDKIIDDYVNNPKNAPHINCQDYNHTPWHNSWLLDVISDELRKQNAKSSTISLSTLKQYRKGKKDISLDFLIAICNVLKVEASDLID